MSSSPPLVSTMQAEHHVDVAVLSALVVESPEYLIQGAQPEIVQNAKLFEQIGEHCKNAEIAHSQLNSLVRQLRSSRITLRDTASFNLAKWYISLGHTSVNNDTLERYTRKLQKWLAMPVDQLPERITITAAVPKWITPGSEVIGLDEENQWWLAVALEVTKNKVKVFWVGFPPKEYAARSRFKQNENPALVDKSMLNAHEAEGDGVLVHVGCESLYNVAWIKQNYLQIPKTFREVVEVNLSDSNTDDENKKAAAEYIDAKGQARNKKAAVIERASRKRGKQASRQAAKQATNLADRIEANNSEPESSASGDDSKQDSVSVDRCRGFLMDAESNSDESTNDSDGDDLRQETSNADSVQRLSENLEQDSAASSDDSGPPLYDITQVFNDVDAAIETLLSLDLGLPPHKHLYDDMASKLTRVASFFAKMYSNSAYNDLVSSTLDELRGYAGQQTPRQFHSKAFLNGLSKFGFCISPRMWKKEEILCIAISVLDLRLDFTGINQKDGIDSKSSFRGMAVLNSSIQRIFYKRLRSYGFVNPRYHPERLQAFSSVVINGGGSWQQSATWEFCKQSCFNIDTTANPFIVRVFSDVGALETAGVYVATTTKNNGKPVYVQVSKSEFKGFPGQEGFCNRFEHDWKSKINQFTTDSQGKRVEACSPRVLVCLNADESKWGIQLLPGYGSDFCILKFVWSKGQTSNIQRFASFDFGKFEAKMQPCAFSITTLCESAADCLDSDGLNRGHTLSFGTSKIVKSVFQKKKAAASFKATPMGPQGWHSDGPRNYNESVFDRFGNLRPDAAACADKMIWKGRWTSLWENPLQHYLSDHIGILQESFSALFGIFKDTYIETPVSPSAKRGQTALKVHVPLGCAVVFTFAWKHRGKGDDPEFISTPQCPVPVHARPHFYAYSSDIRKLPSVDCETTLEFISLCSPSRLNRGSQIQMLDCLQTFDRTSAPGHYEDSDVHELFNSQNDLKDYVNSQLLEQVPADETFETSINCRDWYLWLDSSNQVQLRFNNEAGAACCVTITSANFDSETPSFQNSVRVLYNVIGKPATLVTFPAKAPDTNAFCLGVERSKNLLHAANQATQALSEKWCESSLLRLLSVLNIYVITDCTVTIALGTKHQSGHKYVLLLDGTYDRDKKSFQNEIARPDGEGVAELYRECLKQLVINNGNESVTCMATVDANSKSLEQSSGLFNVGLENVLDSLQISSNSSYSFKMDFNSVFILGTRCVMMTEPIELVYKTAKRLRGACAQKRARVSDAENVEKEEEEGLMLVAAAAAAKRNATWRNPGTLNLPQDGWRTIGDAWNSVKAMPSDFLPNFPDSHFKINQYCEECKDSKLCPTHEPMVCRTSVDLTARHFAAMKLSGHCMIECGGGGDCFYHSMMFLAKLFRQDLDRTWGSHAKLRALTCEKLKTPQGVPQLCLGADGSTISFLESVKMNRKAASPKNLSDNIIVKNYIKYHSQCARNKDGKLVNGAYVENEMIAAVAKQNNIIINVAGHMYEHLQVFTPQGTFKRFDDQEVQSSPFLLWCNGGHYQAIVALSSLEVLNTALTELSFIEGNVLKTSDIRTQ